ncbi:nodulin-related protein 1 [Striga asiatica]|uniref:Nodulin-related protein 1 n=1 Tax=Striga asiatica TaxID=4170 RepID=A0A5A7NYP1_STRAF|nr:nodulin-related protein 1 [Striga asiatica]
MAKQDRMMWITCISIQTHNTETKRLHLHTTARLSPTTTAHPQHQKSQSGHRQPCAHGHARPSAGPIPLWQLLRQRTLFSIKKHLSRDLVSFMVFGRRVPLLQQEGSRPILSSLADSGGRSVMTGRFSQVTAVEKSKSL